MITLSEATICTHCQMDVCLANVNSGAFARICAAHTQTKCIFNGISILIIVLPFNEPIPFCTLSATTFRYLKWRVLGNGKKSRYFIQIVIWKKKKCAETEFLISLNVISFDSHYFGCGKQMQRESFYCIKLSSNYVKLFRSLRWLSGDVYHSNLAWTQRAYTTKSNNLQCAMNGRSKKKKKKKKEEEKNMERYKMCQFFSLIKFISYFMFYFVADCDASNQSQFLLAPWKKIQRDIEWTLQFYSFTARYHRFTTATIV